MTREKRRSTPLTPEEDRERTRAATRAMHEAVQEAKATARQLQAATEDAEGWLDMTADNLDEGFTRFVQDRMDKAAAHIAKSDAQLQATVDNLMDELKEVRAVIDNLEARALGCTDRSHLYLRITDKVQEAVQKPGYVQAVADMVMKSHGCECPPGTHPMSGIAAAVGKSHSPDASIRVRVARAGEATGLYLGDLP